MLSHIYGSRNKSSPKYPPRSPLPPRHERGATKDTMGEEIERGHTMERVGDAMLLEGEEEKSPAAASNSPTRRNNFHLYINKKTCQISSSKNSERVLTLKFASQRKSLELEDNKLEVQPLTQAPDLHTPSFAQQGLEHACSLARNDLPPPEEVSISSATSIMRDLHAEKKQNSPDKQSIMTERQSRGGTTLLN